MLSNFRNEFRRDAPHRSHLRTHSDFIAACIAAGSELSTIFDSPGLLLKYFAVDQMHGEHLGPLLDAIGSIIWIEINNKSWYRNQREGLKAVNAELKDFHTAHPELGHFNKIVMGQIRSKTAKYPVFKGKAAQAKHMIQFCLLLAYKHSGFLERAPFEFRASHRLHGHASEYRRLVVSLFEGMAAYTSACDARPFAKLPCILAMYQFLDSLEKLNTLWCQGLVDDEAKAAMPFHVRPKMHMCQHLVEDQLEIWGNPRNFSCYLDENFIGGLKRVCAMPKHPRTLEVVGMYTCRLLVGTLEECERRRAG